MIATVQFYLTTFHAGRNVSCFCQIIILSSCLLFNVVQSDVAKKPYNPVLGEVFRCYVDAPGTSSRVPLDQMSEVSLF